MKKNVIVSLADANYYPLLDELINSIKQFKQSQNIAICILDAGLEAHQKKNLLQKVDEIKPAEWDIEVPGYKVKDKGIFLIIINIYGLIVMPGSMIGNQLNFILKLVKMVNLELLKQLVLVIELQLKLAGYLVNWQ